MNAVLLALALLRPTPIDLETALRHDRIPIQTRLYVKRLRLFVDTTMDGDWLTCVHPTGQWYDCGLYWGRVRGRFRVFMADLTPPWDGVEAPIRR